MANQPYEIGRGKFLDRGERTRLIKYCRERAKLDEVAGRTAWPRRYMLIDLALFTGLRVAEIADLEIRDLMLKADQPYLVVRHGKGSMGGKRRDVYLDDALVKHLKDYIKHHLVNPDTTAPLFPGREGNHSPAITLMKSFKAAIMSAGLPLHYSIHSCRHTYATYLLHDTQNLRYVQKQLGHAQISMTALYSDVLPEQNGKLANMIKRDEP